MSPADEMPGALSEVTRAVYDRISGPKELLEVQGGHFGLLEHPSVTFHQTSQAQATWLTRTLWATAQAAACQVAAGAALPAHGAQ